MFLVDNLVTFVQTSGFNFLHIFMALQMEGFLGVDFLFEEPEEFSKEEAFVRRNQMCPLEMWLVLMQIGLNHQILISLVNSTVNCAMEEMLCIK